MASAGAYLSSSLTAGEDFTNVTDRYKFVVCDVDHEVVKAGGATEEILGVNNDTPSDQEAIEVVHGGVFKVLAGGSFNQGARLTSDANGKAIATTTSGDNVGAIALEDGVDGKVVKCKLVHYEIT